MNKEVGDPTSLGFKVQRRKKVKNLFLFVGPALLINVLIVLIPSISTVALSFFKWDGINPPIFIGLQNFKHIFLSMDFLQALTHNVVWTIVFLTIPVAMGLIGAELLRRSKQKFFLAFYFFPTILPIVVVGIIWSKIYHPIHGLGKYLGIALLGNTSTALYAIAFANIWAWWGFLCAVFYSAIQGISKDLYEAAKLDGATKWHEFRYITLPGILPTIVFMEIMTIIWSFQVFDWVWVTTQGGPAGSTELLATLMYKKAFYSYKVGEASAIGTMMAVFGMLATLIYYYLKKKGVEV